MQSSLFRFMRRMEKERKQTKKRPHDATEDATEDVGLSCCHMKEKESDRKRQKVQHNGEGLRESTVSKLQGFSHTQREKAVLAFSSTGMRDSLIGAETSTNGTRNDGTGSSTIIVTGTSLNGTDNSTIGTGTSLNGVDNSGTGTSLNGADNSTIGTGTSLNGTGNSTVSTENILSNSKNALNGSGSANGASQVISKRLLREIKPSKHQYTPLQQQYLSIKSSHPDAVLFIECGYKYKFFGEDAVTASKVLKIGCFTDHNLKTGSIPVYRLNVHLRRLVAAGYKVGVVKQMETAALKAAGSNKSGPFSRQLTALYTRSTLIGADVEEFDAATPSGGGDTGGEFMICISELASTKSIKKKEKDITIGFTAVQPSTGNILYDEFRDNVNSFSELETRLSHVQPVEIFYPRGTSKALEQMLRDWKVYNENGSNILRLETLPQEWFEYNKAFSVVTEFYAKSGDGDSGNDDDREGSISNGPNIAEALQVAINLPSISLSCLSGLIHYLKPFNLQRVLMLTKHMHPFSTGMYCMKLNGRTLESLEIFKNTLDRTSRGTLFQVLDHTHTPFGRRLLTKWIMYPLKDIGKIKQRQAAVTELNRSEHPSLSLLKASLQKLPDLEKKLCSAYHKKCSPAEFYYLIKHLSQIFNRLDSFSDMAVQDLKSELLSESIKEIPALLKNVEEISNNLSEKAAKEADYENLFVEVEQFPDVVEEKRAISNIKQRLQDQRILFRNTLSDLSRDYITVSGEKYLVEVKKKEMDKVPTDWYRVSSTKQVTRFRPPYVVESLRLLAQHHEQLLIHAKAAWNSILDDFSDRYGSYKRAVDILASIDCLISLSEVAKILGYVCPEIVEEQVIEITQGRHPIIDLLLEGGQYVANDTKLLGSEVHSMIITGPNMGGKSSYIKQVALICILGQIGSYVPAGAARLGILDGVYTRMGAYDNILSGRSTFMTELMEAGEIMRHSTANSLVIMDELGRGTSTHDGTAIAYATLNYLLEEVKCMSLFVTHYPLVIELEKKHPNSVANFHMAYVQVESAEEEFDRVVFLYHLDKGQAGSSYGLNVASLAGLPSSLLQRAHCKSKQLEESKLPLGTAKHDFGTVSKPASDLVSLMSFLNHPHDSISKALKTYFS